MPSVVLPAGVVPIEVPSGTDALTTHRVQSVWVEMLDSDMGILGTLDGVTGGSCAWTSSASVKGSGSLDVQERGQDIDWLSVRLRVVAEVENYGSWGLGVFLPDIPERAWNDETSQFSVTLLGLETVLAQDELAESYSLPAGTVIIDAVRDLIEAAGENAGAVTDSDAELATGKVWPAGTSRLAVINDLLDTANYFALFTDGDGAFRAEPYSRPAQRAPRWLFTDESDGIYRPQFTRSEDLYKVPNRLIARQPGVGNTEGLAASWDNTDPLSPFSIDARGRVISRTEDWEAPDEVTLEAIARRRLIELSSPSASINIEHLLVPLAVNDAARFRRGVAEIDTLVVVSRIELDIAATTLMRTTLREVVDL